MDDTPITTIENLSNEAKKLIARIRKTDSDLAEQLKHGISVLRSPDDEEQKMALDIFDVDQDAAVLIVDLMVKDNSPKANELLSLQMDEYIKPESIELHAYEKYVHWSTMLSVAEWIRNVLVLAPITLTWYELSLAASNYAKLLAEKPEKIEVPFLLLWEQNFGFPVGISMNFSRLAMLDFYFLLVVVGITMVVHLWRDLRQVSAEKRALDLRKRLEKYLSKLEHKLSPLRYKHTGSQQSEQFDKAIQIFRSVTVELTKELAQFTVCGENFTVGVQRMREQTDTLTPLYNSLRNVVEKLQVNLQQNNQQQATINKTLGSIGSDFNITAQNFQQIDIGLKSIAQQMAVSSGAIGQEKLTTRETLEQLSTLLGRLSENDRAVRDAIVNVASNAQDTDKFVRDTITKIYELDEHIKSQRADSEAAMQNMFVRVGDATEKAIQRSSITVERIAEKVSILDQSINRLEKVLAETNQKITRIPSQNPGGNTIVLTLIASNLVIITIFIGYIVWRLLS